jgi:hypothetical protein
VARRGRRLEQGVKRAAFHGKGCVRTGPEGRVRVPGSAADTTGAAGSDSSAALERFDLQTQRTMLAVTAGGQLSAKRSSETSAIASLPRCASSSNVTSRETSMLRAPTASSAVRSSSTRSSETSCSSLNGAVRTLYVDGTAPIVKGHPYHRPTPRLKKRGRPLDVALALWHNAQGPASTAHAATRSSRGELGRPRPWACGAFDSPQAGPVPLKGGRRGVVPST